MTQDEINLVYAMTISIYQDSWFKEDGRTRDEVQDWVRERLAMSGIHTIPVGCSWGSKVSKEYYDEFQKGYTVDNYRNILRRIRENDNPGSQEMARLLGAAEAILVNNNKLEPGKSFDNIKKDIAYEMPKFIFFGRKLIKTRKQTYREMIIDMLEGLVIELEELIVE